MSGTDGRNGYGTVCLETHAFIGFSSDPNTRVRAEDAPTTRNWYAERVSATPLR